MSPGQRTMGLYLVELNNSRILILDGKEVSSSVLDKSYVFPLPLHMMLPVFITAA